jgi:hypothetical protein
MLGINTGESGAFAHPTCLDLSESSPASRASASSVPASVIASRLNPLSMASLGIASLLRIALRC